ncbi:SIR2 family protein [Pelotomaculum terephthalicicum JT]|uniref:SIR2 family protein n=1 Tax=Pelotomaculum terephthalicicum TaxID=206393 RepID=UPI001F04667A|nr:SIR2 family protein [Pelotomaculum terephthalicicum]MCG9968856.1 SIR2 family protein [Pelotomaculum terephthalicicum JT]
MNTVYVFGAGASAAEGAPVLHDFLKIAFKFFKEEHYSTELDVVWEFLEHFNGSGEVLSHSGELEDFPGLEEIFNIVDWSLLQNQAFSIRFPRARLHELKTALVKLISMTLDKSLPSYNGMHQSFVAEVIRGGEEIPTFISLNYDIVLDNAIRATGYEPEYGFYGNHLNHMDHCRKIPLYKLHGSLNWSFCPLCGEISEHNEKVAHLLFKDKYSIACLNCGSDSSQAIIIAPTLYKSYNISRLQNVWDCAVKSISLSDRLVFVGYSLAPADTSIITTIKRALNIINKEREIVVINPNEQACRRYKQIFGKNCRVLCHKFTGEHI